MTKPLPGEMRGIRPAPTRCVKNDARPNPKVEQHKDVITSRQNHCQSPDSSLSSQKSGIKPIFYGNQPKYQSIQGS
jgi:hypothetical protein